MSKRWAYLLVVVGGVLGLSYELGLPSGKADVPRPTLGRAAATGAPWVTHVLGRFGFWLSGSELVDEPLQRVMTRAGNVVLIPADCLPWDGPYDVIVHFHGIHTALEPALVESGVAAVMVITNDGIGAGAYAQKYQFERSLPWLLEGVEKVMQERCPMPGRRVGRVALSAWSAGFAAVQKILGWPHHFDRVEAVLLADGMHARVDNQGALSEHDLAGFLRFAREAVAGRKLMAVTHSDIDTDGYASTTQTANYLLSKLGIVPVCPERAQNPPRMQLATAAERGSFYLMGFTGEDKAAHISHQRGMGHTLLPLLRAWWKKKDG